jgi:hypothetical protein
MQASLARPRRSGNARAGPISGAFLSWYYPGVLTLGELVEQNGPLSVRDAIGWTLRTAQALWLIHADGRCHGRVHAGAVRVDGADCTAEGVLSRPSRLADDAAYQGIDRADGAGPSMRDDVWALGILLYYLLTAERPYPKGIAASIHGGRLRAPTLLAVHQAELDVMQPVVDRLIRLDLGVALTIEEVVGGLRDFSPALVDLPPLALERDTTAPPDAGARLRSRRGWWATAVLLGLLAIAAVYIALDRSTPSRPVAAVPPPPPAAATADPPLPSPTATPPSASPVPGDGDLVACISPLFPSAAFPHEITADFPCRERDPKALVGAITKVLVQGAGAGTTTALRDWDALGWYRLATAAVARGRCCDRPPPLEASPLLRACEIDLALERLTLAIDGGEAELSAALEGYRKAMRCVNMAGGGTLVDPQLEASPTGAQAALFIRVLTRLRNRP